MTSLMKAQEKEAVMEEMKSAGFEVLYGGSKGHGFWVKGVVNPNGPSNEYSQSTWHSMDECRTLIEQKNLEQKNLEQEWQ